MVYWLVSLPLLQSRRDRTWEALQEKTSYGQQLSSNSKLEVPELRVGTLDTLMALSDDLVKVNTAVEAIVSKIRRTIHDIAGPSAIHSLKVENLPVESYLTRFKWDEPKFPVRRPLKETVEKIGEVMSHIEDELKMKVSEYNTVKSQISAALRKQGGSLAVRDISGLVKPSQVIDSENLVTLFVVVSKYSIKDWETTYEKLCDFVVPRSTRIITEDQDYALCSVVLFRRVADDFKTAARLKGFQVKEYVPPAPEGAAAEVPVNMSLDQLKAEGEAKRATLETWCRTAYGEAFVSWMHLCVVRLFVESILRYGLPPAFQAAVVKPLPKMEVRLRTALATTFGTGVSYWKDEGAVAAGTVVSELDAHPYVSLTVQTE